MFKKKGSCATVTCVSGSTYFNLYDLYAKYIIGINTIPNVIGKNHIPSPSDFPIEVLIVLKSIKKNIMITIIFIIRIILTEFLY